MKSDVKCVPGNSICKCRYSHVCSLFLSLFVFFDAVLQIAIDLELLLCSIYDRILFVACTVAAQPMFGSMDPASKCRETRYGVERIRHVKGEPKRFRLIDAACSRANTHTHQHSNRTPSDKWMLCATVTTTTTTTTTATSTIAMN